MFHHTPPTSWVPKKTEPVESSSRFMDLKIPLTGKPSYTVTRDTKHSKRCIADGEPASPVGPTGRIPSAKRLGRLEVPVGRVERLVSESVPVTPERGFWSIGRSIEFG